MDFLLFSNSLLFFFFLFFSVSSAYLSFEEGFSQLFGDSNLMLLDGGKTVRISLDQRTGSGFKSQDQFLHGYFSASIKLHPGYTAGIVVAFYLTNDREFKYTHDELDFEFLGNIKGKQWRIQTNVYVNGSTNIGREERYDSWFDPTEDFHKYSILWTQDRIVFFMDDIPIREALRDSMESFPSKPMSLYVTIWDGSQWATSGGKDKVDYRLAPFAAEFKHLILQGCTSNPTDNSVTGCDDRALGDVVPHRVAAEEHAAAMLNFRRNHMSHYYCYKREKYNVPPPECSNDQLGMMKHYKMDGHINSRERRHRSLSRRGRHSRLIQGF